MDNNQNNYSYGGTDYQNMGNQQQEFNEHFLPEEYKSLSMWAYFGYEILFSLPCIGLILLLVFSFGGTRNINLKNFARSYFCFLIIASVLGVVLAGILGIGAAAASGLY